jgi:hypothetical protein
VSLDFYLEELRPCEVFSRNITHNLGAMADAAGIYNALWHPERLGLGPDVLAHMLIGQLETGLAELEAYPERFRQYDAANGWGRYEHFVPFVRACLEACREHPEARVRTSI